MNPIKRSLEPDGPLTFGILTILFHFCSFLLFSDPVGSQLLAKRIQSTVDANVGVLCQLKTTQVMVSLLPLLFLASLVDSRPFASILPLLRSINILTSCWKVLNPETLLDIAILSRDSFQFCNLSLITLSCYFFASDPICIFVPSHHSHFRMNIL